MEGLDDRRVARCSCCGLVPVWFGTETWCLCEAASGLGRICGQPHECTAERRLHHHAFRRIIAEEDMTGSPLGIVLACACGLERRLEPAA